MSLRSWTGEGNLPEVEWIDLHQGAFFGDDDGAWQAPTESLGRAIHHNAVGVVVTVARRAPPNAREHQAKGARRGSTNPSYESRPAEPGASSCFVRTRYDSSIADFGEEASCFSLLRRRELGFEAGRGTFDAAPLLARIRNG